MSQSYCIEPDFAAGLLSVTLHGFFSIDNVASMRFDLRAGIKELMRRPGDHVSLYDIRECKIQSQEVVSALRAMSDAKGVVARRVAVVTGSSLMRRQLPRILVDREARFFQDLEGAREWLLEKPSRSNSTSQAARPIPPSAIHGRSSQRARGVQ